MAVVVAAGSEVIAMAMIDAEAAMEAVTAEVVTIATATETTIVAMRIVAAMIVAIAMIAALVALPAAMIEATETIATADMSAVTETMAATAAAVAIVMEVDARTVANAMAAEVAVREAKIAEAVTSVDMRIVAVIGMVAVLASPLLVPLLPAATASLLLEARPVRLMAVRRSINSRKRIDANDLRWPLNRQFDSHFRHLVSFDKCQCRIPPSFLCSFRAGEQSDTQKKMRLGVLFRHLSGLGIYS